MTADNKTETELRSRNTPAIIAYAIGATKDNKMKIFKIISLRSSVKTMID